MSNPYPQQNTQATAMGSKRLIWLQVSVWWRKKPIGYREYGWQKVRRFLTVSNRRSQLVTCALGATNLNLRKLILVEQVSFRTP